MIPIHAVIEKVAEVVRNGRPAKKLPDKRWRRLKSDLEELTTPQRTLVFKLVEQMKKVNKEESEAVEYQTLISSLTNNLTVAS